MRVISGSARGRRIDAPLGELTRPTSSLIKGAIFNILQFEIEGRTVLDLFAGSGQLGIEALSRGAQRVTFCDCRRDAANIIEKNLRNTGFCENSAVLCSDFTEAIRKSKEHEFDIILLDPPYGGELMSAALKNIVSFDILSESGIIVCEAAKHDNVFIPALTSGYHIRKEYFYGAKKLVLIERI